eukprot:CAMPEP_0177584976 /NCGR_PEP_ID=MMETSP0419_2-20121207/4213_1 /TAXON_ID=582737 /ORGANISM="Tetraselmis sp., Strain GSL018" /LENGTH=164 /DNA_ID=CAMNT_0019074611 /DNA_START=192 /DNA_END=683 /DNA_ORIENTATION=+
MRSTRLSFFKSPGIPVPGIVKVNRSHTGFSISSEHANWNGEEGHSNSALTDPSVPEVANSRTKQVNGLVGSNPSSPERDPSAEQHDSQREYISKGTRFTEGNYDQAESVSDDNKYCSSAKVMFTVSMLDAVIGSWGTTAPNNMKAFLNLCCLVGPLGNILGNSW